MTNEELNSLKVGQIIYSNHGSKPLKIMKTPIGVSYPNGKFVVKDIHNCNHQEPIEYIKNRFEIKPVKIMTREEAAHLSNVLKAYSEGNEIEHLRTDGIWDDICNDPTFSESAMNYRIKPKPEYRKYKNADEFLKGMAKHGMYLKDSYDEDNYVLPIFIGNSTVAFNDEIQPSYEELLKYYKWQDGTPVGIKLCEENFQNR